jgi:hypothetical protein
MNTLTTLKAEFEKLDAETDAALEAWGIASMNSASIPALNEWASNMAEEIENSAQSRYRNIAIRRDRARNAYWDAEISAKKAVLAKRAADEAAYKLRKCAVCG